MTKWRHFLFHSGRQGLIFVALVVGIVFWAILSMRKQVFNRDSE